jgi:hypothetical protein
LDSWEVTSHGVWLSFRFCLSDRDVEALMTERGVMLTSDAVRYGAGPSGRPRPISCGTDGLGLAIRGISMRSSAPSTMNGTPLAYRSAQARWGGANAAWAVPQ